MVVSFMTNRLRSVLAVVTTTSPHHPHAHLKTSSVGFAIWWIILLFLHGVNVGYYVGAAKLYWFIFNTNLDFQLTTYSIGIDHTQWSKVAVIHSVVATAHVLFMIAMIVGSLQARRLVFQPDYSVWVRPLLRKVCSSTMKREVSGTEGRRNLHNNIARRMSSFTDSTVALTNSVFGREGFLGVDGPYFDHLHLVRELVETTLQTIQVYRMSYLLPRLWLIRFYVILLIANCWSTPLVHQYYANRHTQRRMMSLLTDAVLDMVSSIGVSLWIFATYLPQYTDPAWGFPFANWFDDVWFTTMQQEFQMMMVVSWYDMASRLVFAVGLLQCMDSIKEMLVPVELPAKAFGSPKKKEDATVKPQSAHHNKSEEAQDRSVDESAKDSAIVDKIAAVIVETDVTDPAIAKQHKTMGAVKVTALKSQAHHATRWSRIVHFLLGIAGPGFFLVLGFAILVVHIVSETRHTSTDIPCQLTLHPWFVNKPACTLVEFDCHSLGHISGSQDSMKAAWNTFEFGATARIFVRHCPQLEMPSTIQKYTQITSLKLYNCTITSWPDQAAFVAAFHQKMRAIFAVRTEFPNGELPDGLILAHYPKGLKSFVTSVTNIRALPDNLNEVWPPGMTLSFEHSQLQAVPPALISLKPSLVALAGTEIGEVPREFFENPLLECVLLSYTKVQELPRDVQSINPGLYLMFLEGTNVSTFWSWMEPFIQYSFALNNGFFNAHGSRYCAERDEIVAHNRTSFSITTAEPNAHDLASVMDMSTPAALQYDIQAVVCDPGFPFYFPLELQDMNSAISTA